MSRWIRYTPLTGVAFVALLVASFAVGGSTPGVKATGQHVVSFYTNNRGSQQASGFLGLYAVVFFVFFAGSLRGYLRRVRPDAGPLAATSLAGAAVLAVGGAILSGLEVALSDQPSKLDPSAAQALSVLSNDLFVPLIVGTCVFMIANGLAILRWGGLPRWLGWIAIVIGVVAVTPIGFIGFLATVAWVLVTSIVMFTARPGDVEPAAPPPAATPA